MSIETRAAKPSIPDRRPARRDVREVPNPIRLPERALPAIDPRPVTPPPTTPEREPARR